MVLIATANKEAAAYGLTTSSRYVYDLHGVYITSCRMDVFDHYEKFDEEEKLMDNMKYTEALRKLFEVMEGRPDIKEVKFDRENDSFDVISDTGVHVCFGNEFRDK